MGEDKSEHGLGYTYTEKKDCSNFFPKSKFEIYATELIRILHEKVDNLAEERNIDQQINVESSFKEESTKSY